MDASLDASADSAFQTDAPGPSDAAADAPITLDVGDAAVEMCVTYGVAGGTVDADLIGRTNYIDLHDMPAPFWAGVSPDGAGVRVRAMDGAPMPTDLVTIDIQGQTGTLFFRGDLASAGSEYEVCYGTGLPARAPEDPLGRNGVWRDYSAMTLLGEDPEDRTGNSRPGLTQGTVFEGQVAAVPGSRHTFRDHEAHQGVAINTATGDRYVIHTDAIYRYDAEWTLQETNASPIADSGISANHLGDGCFHEGELFIVLEDYPSGPYVNQHVVVYDENLVFLRSHDISAQRHEVSSIAFSPMDERFYITDFVQGEVHTYDTSTFEYFGTWEPDIRLSRIQGIEWWLGSFWVVDTNRLTQIRFDGTVTGTSISSSAVVEGIASDGEYLYWLRDPSGRTNSYIEQFGRATAELTAGQARRLFGADTFELLDVPTSSAFTLGVSAMRGADTGRNQAAVTLGTDEGRVSIVHRASTSSFGVWDTANLWLMSNPAAAAAVGEFRTYAASYGTGARSLFVDGALSASGDVDTSRPSPLTRLAVSSQAESWNGAAGMLYVLPQEMSPAWHRALFRELSAPASFYTLTAHE